MAHTSPDLCDGHPTQRYGQAWECCGCIMGKRGDVVGVWWERVGLCRGHIWERYGRAWAYIVEVSGCVVGIVGRAVDMCGLVLDGYGGVLDERGRMLDMRGGMSWTSMDIFWRRVGIQKPRVDTLWAYVVAQFASCGGQRYALWASRSGHSPNAWSSTHICGCPRYASCGRMSWRRWSCVA